MNIDRTINQGGKEVAINRVRFVLDNIERLKEITKEIAEIEFNNKKSL